MTIAIVSMIRDPGGGSEELWYQMAKVALQQEHKVIHLRFENPQVHPKMEELIKNGLIAYTRPGYVPVQAGELKKKAYITYNFIRKKLKDPFKSIFDQRPDIVLYNGTCYSIARENPLLIKLSKYSNTKFFLIGHLNHDLLREINDAEAAMIRNAYMRCEQVFFVSERNAHTAQRHLCTDINYKIIRNPVNLTSTEIIEYPDITSTINFALVGNLVTNHKGQDLLLHALSDPVWKTRNWKLNIYGDGYDKKYLQTLVTYFGLDKKVVFHGKVDDIRGVWRENHLLLMPSIMEGMPLAVVEAMLCGRVCLATDVGGNIDWIDDGMNGFIVPAPTVALLKEGLERVWNQRAHWEQMGRSAHETAMQLYDKNAGETLLKAITDYDKT
jgi:L-malate glycosyltransferase